MKMILLIVNSSVKICWGFWMFYKLVYTVIASLIGFFRRVNYWIINASTALSCFILLQKKNWTHCFTERVNKSEIYKLFFIKRPILYVNSIFKQ